MSYLIIDASNSSILYVIHKMKDNQAKLEHIILYI